ncbi:peptide chain release factor N(5)-glutamine methyltransferase [Microbacterium sp. YY-01]|uniref:peptide chain release factor N(5)-glutamine methyltransferase n=1 Tax=Microbacterium sp. YY-01 TaxID=3421634 RepID=UPI003D180DF8
MPSLNAWAVSRREYDADGQCSLRWTTVPDASYTYSTVLSDAADTLSAAGITDAMVDAELLLGFVTGLSRGGVAAAAIRRDTLDAAAHAQFVQLVHRRAERVPLQHLTGQAPFRNLVLSVGPGVFVPRPETEGVAQLAIDALLAAAQPTPIAIDLGAGSGAIAAAMATEVPHARVFAVELSEQALTWARRNTAGIHNLTLIHGDLGEACSDIAGQAAVVISNPPYVPDAAIPRDPEVRLHDPHMALYGGADGLDIVRVISQRALQLLHPGGLVVLEHAEVQGAAIRELLSADGWVQTATHQDLTRRDRATTAIKPV